MRIRAATVADVAAWSALRAALWPDADAAELQREAAAFFAGTQSGQPIAAVLLAEDGEGVPCGMIELSLRLYAEGCGTSPVPYVEGWYVAPDQRGRGIGRALAAAAEAWALAEGHAELASDALLENTASHKAHAALGFTEVERSVHFRKILKPSPPSKRGERVG